MRLINKDTLEYPVSLSRFKKKINVSWGADIDFGRYGHAVVKEAPMPVCTSLQKQVELPPKEIDGVWTQQWAVEDLEGQELVDAQDMIIAAALEAEITAEKESVLSETLPSWETVETVIGNIASLADAKAYLTKLSRVVYLLAKNSID